jgi:hypothetical protein
MKLETKCVTDEREIKAVRKVLSRMQTEGKLTISMSSASIFSRFSEADYDIVGGCYTTVSPRILAICETKLDRGTGESREYTLIGNKQDLDQFYELAEINKS